MPEEIEILGYSSAYNNISWSDRNSMSESHQLVLDDIIFNLTQNPNQYSNLTFKLIEGVFVYKHPEPQIEVTYMVDRDKLRMTILHVVAPKLKRAKSLFISYSHKDKQWLDELKKWLKPLEQNDLISIWDDEKILPGDEWKQKIKEALDEAKVAVLLVSQDFLCSDFIAHNELPQLLDAAEQKGVKILWIGVSPCTVEETSINKYQAVHKDPPLDQLDRPHQNATLKNIYQSIKTVVDK